jgi:predicted CopG family antitoxin
MDTTIQISAEVRKELEKLKIHRREALNEVIKRLIDIDESVGGFDVNEIEEIKNSLIDIKKGDFVKVSDAESAIKHLES